MNEDAAEVTAITESFARVECNDNQDIDVPEALILVQELMDSIKQDIDMDYLRTAITLLQQALSNGNHTAEDRGIIEYSLIKALLIQYGFHGWMEDLDLCWYYLGRILQLGTLGNWHIDDCTGPEEVQIAVQLIRACQNSLDIKTLNILIRVAAGIFSSWTASTECYSNISELLVVLGNALVMGFLNNGQSAYLDQAAGKFRLVEMLVSSDSDSPLLYVSIISQAYVECLRILACGETDRFPQLWGYLEKADSADREGRELLRTGTTLARNATHDAQLQEAIECLTNSLHHRIAPHPRRFSSLDVLLRAHCTRFERYGAFIDIEEFITLNEEGLRLLPTSHSKRSTFLEGLAIALSTRFHQSGALQDLEDCIKLNREVLSIPPATNFDRSHPLNNLAIALSTRFKQQGRYQDLEECIVLHRKALDLRPASHPSHPSSLNNLASSLHTRFDHNGMYEDLEECIALHQAALSYYPSPHPDRSMSLNNLANALSARFEQLGNREDLEESVKLNREALDLVPASHADCFLALQTLAGSLRIRFELGGALEDIKECISLNQKALDLLPGSHSGRRSIIHNLAIAHLSRFESSGTIQDLEECIALGREALSMRLAVHTDSVLSLNTLANALCTRFDRKGALQDLEESIDLYRVAIDLLPRSHPNHTMLFNNLATALGRRFEQRNAFEDLEECINLYREVLALMPRVHSDCFKSMVNLASSLHTRFKQNNRFKDLEESIGLYREALDLCPPLHTDRSMCLNNLASTLSTRFRRLGALQDFDECIQLHRKALDLRPSPCPDRSMSLHNLAAALSNRIEQNTENDRIEEDITVALEYYEQGSNYLTGSVLKRLSCSKDWARFTRKHRPPLAMNAYRCSMELLPLLAPFDLTLQQRQDVLHHTRDLVGEAAKCAIDVHKCALAVTFLSTGRSVFWSQALQLRTPVDKLAVEYPRLAENFSIVSRQLENASHAVHSSSDPFTQKPDTDSWSRPDILVDQRHEIIEEIRKLPGYEDFLLPPSFTRLASAAANGPVVFLNASEFGCDALILNATETVKHVPLSDIDLKDLRELKSLVRALLDADTESSIDLSRSGANVLQRLLGRDLLRNTSANLNVETFRWTLECLWSKVVRPVIDLLGIEKTSSSRRIWWCPTGPFSSLPFHAAGIYSDNNEPIDCIFQYAISSYCTSPQDLLHSPPLLSQDFKMTAITEPEVPDADFLPATRKELDAIKKRAPHTQNLLLHMGSKDSQIQVDDLFSDIRQSQLVHFGCHGMQNPINPLESYLLLSSGRLTISRIIKECQASEGALAYLSACETAKGDELRPDESLNLVATMMFAGFRGVVGTMWSIFDEDAPVVADVFYRHLFRNGKQTPPNVRDAAYGLHLATTELRKRGKPFRSWVPYVHYGI